MKVGDKFSSYEEFISVLTEYKKSVHNEFWIRDARTIENQRKRAPESVVNINKTLKYYHMRLACVKGGRPFKSKNEHSKRKCTTYKEDCEATIFLRVTACKQYLCVLELKDNHNHTSSETYFTTLSQQRLQLPANVKNFASESLKAGANKKVVLDKIRAETGNKITLKDLTNISRRTSERKNFQECVNMLKNIYDCSDIQLLMDEHEVFKGLYFQDKRMKKYMEAFPEILFIDGTYCLVDLKTATYIIMIEDGCGFSEIVAVCLLVDEDEPSINFFIETFKNRNPAWKKVQVIMSDKDKTERKVFQKHFPDAKLQICLFHVFQIFNREVSFKKMGITADEVKISKEYLQKLANASSESDYNKIYDEMASKVPKIVKEYYDVNWACISDQWVQYLTLQNLCFANKTNNRLESVNSKLKSVINRYSPLEDFIKHLFAYINSVRVGKDVKNCQMLNTKLAKPYVKNSAEYLYREYLTTFAFEKVETQLNIFKKYNYKEFNSIGDDVFLAETSEGLIQVTSLSCECLFRKSTQLPCRHIFYCRSKLSLHLFDVNLCLNRWSRSYCANILDEFGINEKQTDQKLGPENTYVTDYNKDDIQVTQLKGVKPKYMTNHAKFKLMDDQGKKMAQLCSEVSTPIFCERLKIIQFIIKQWEEGQDENLKDIFKGSFPESSNYSNQHIDNVLINYAEQEVQQCESVLATNVNQTQVEEIQCQDETENDGVLCEIAMTTIPNKIQEFDNPQTNNGENQVEKEVIIECTGFTHDDEVHEIRDVHYEDDLQSSNIVQQIEIDTSIKEGATISYDSILQNLKMPVKIKKRGRPKGYGNTVIGLKRKKLKKK